MIIDELGCYFILVLIDKWKVEKMYIDFLNFDVIEKFKDFGGICLEDDILIILEGFCFIGEKCIFIIIEEVEIIMNE